MRIVLFMILDGRSLEACSLGWRAFGVCCGSASAKSAASADAIIHSLGGGNFHLSLSREFNLLEYVPR